MFWDRLVFLNGPVTFLQKGNERSGQWIENQNPKEIKSSMKQRQYCCNRIFKSKQFLQRDQQGEQYRQQQKGDTTCHQVKDHMRARKAFCIRSSAEHSESGG